MCDQAALSYSLSQRGSEKISTSGNITIFSSFVELKAVDIRQIYDKFPEKKGGLKELYDKGPQAVFFLVKFWVGRTVIIIFLCYEVWFWCSFGC